MNMTRWEELTGYSEINKASEPTESEINQNKLVYKYDIEDKLTEIRYPKASSDKLKGIKFEYNDYKWLVKIKGIMYESGTEVTRDIRDYEYYNDSKVNVDKGMQRLFKWRKWLHTEILSV